MGAMISSSQSKFDRKVHSVVKEVLGDHPLPEWANANSFTNGDDLENAMLKVGLESSNLIIGIDFTKSNLDLGRKSFEGRSLHTLGVPGGNPYQQVIEVMGKTLAKYDNDNKIVSFGFGDIISRHSSVTNVGPASGCDGFEGVLASYAQKLQTDGFRLSGPTSFAPVINQAVDLVRKSGNQYHILLLIGDGCISEELNCMEDTLEAIVKASSVPLSIVMVGVGDGPWDTMQKFDDELPRRRFDNFQFVEFTKFSAMMKGAKKREQEIAMAAFKMCALMEIPAQYRDLREFGLIENIDVGRKDVLRLVGDAGRTGEKRERDEAAAPEGDMPTRRLRLN